LLIQKQKDEEAMSGVKHVPVNNVLAAPKHQWMIRMVPRIEGDVELEDRVVHGWEDGLSSRSPRNRLVRFWII
jgi:hypothetical protein